MEYLSRRASDLSGVEREEADKIDTAGLYEKLGPGTIREISEAFYAAVYSREGWFREIFSNVEKEHAINNQYTFFVEKFGGPRIYTATKGHTALIGRHGPYKISHAAAQEWLACMEEAIDTVPSVDQQSRTIMMNYFKHMAYYISCGMDLVNQNRLVGYGDRPGGYHQLGN
ncbi:hypothetical protein NDN08_002678 [Rhodosorus marinus]|uniref:Globin family profile domain-containing protein n=1 Tax=Rhodosorus marinus TaxID=101924 RepID=A0AAV8UUG2_9RHOD|nr:hypothetical protein NDN08_002678 [Rhodosorus marinus]